LIAAQDFEALKLATRLTAVRQFEENRRPAALRTQQSAEKDFAVLGH
jgi:hypothetical protein